MNRLMASVFAITVMLGISSTSVMADDTTAIQGVVVSYLLTQHRGTAWESFGVSYSYPYAFVRVEYEQTEETELLYKDAPGYRRILEHGKGIYYARDLMGLYGMTLAQANALLRICPAQTRRVLLERAARHRPKTRIVRVRYEKKLVSAPIDSSRTFVCTR